MEPLVKGTLNKYFLERQRFSLFELRPGFGRTSKSLSPKKMELGQNYDYLLYHTEADWDADPRKDSYY